MTEVTDLISSARAAFVRKDWDAARRGLLAARNRMELAAPELEVLAESGWWLGNVPESLAFSEDVYRRLHGGGDHAAAAMKAIELSLQWATRGDIVVASGWMNRARRLLRQNQETAEYGYLLYVESSQSMDLEEDPGPAQEAAETLDHLAELLDNPTLACFAHVLIGLALVRGGQTDAGFKELDEAMLSVLAGDIPPVWAGDIYCTVVHLCHILGDFSRMRAWNSALERWTVGLSATFIYAGVTRIHDLQLISAEGDWDTVEREIGPRSDQLVDAHGWMAGAGYYELGEVRRLKGNVEGARAAYASARNAGVDPQPGEALLKDSAGEHEPALNQLRAAIGESGPLERARLLLPAIELALTQGHRALADTWSDDLQRIAAKYSSPGIQAWARHARGAVLLATGQAAEAVPHLDSAARTYREQRVRYSTAKIHELLAECRRELDQPDAADAELATALAIYRQLGAFPDSERIAGGHAPGGLTPRESEVLSLVCGGASNRQVAQTLVISEKTVGRHLANIFTKIGVESRTAAAAWARERNLPSRIPR
jgi:ATP/maltotriose-dependent transcriptional regulator MalT